MPLGAFLPTRAFSQDPTAIREWTQAVEELGYDYIAAIRPLSASNAGSERPGGTLTPGYAPRNRGEALAQPMSPFTRRARK